MTASTYQAVVSASGFSLGVRCNDDEVFAIDFLEPRAELRPETLLAREAVRQLRAYLADARFEFALPLAPAGTAFQRRVWSGVATIPAGRTRSYGELAQAIGSGARAVGNACGANPYPVVVPCHRVVAANFHGLPPLPLSPNPSPARGEGSVVSRWRDSYGIGAGLGGFARQRGGFLLGVKRWLLDHEQRAASST